MARSRIVTLGNAFLDTIVYLPELPSAPIKLRALDVRRTGGGIAATAAYTISALGADTIYWGRLGQDDTGDQILSRLGAAGVETGAVRRVPGGVSPIGTILVSPDGDRMAFGFIGRNLGDDADWLPLHELDGVDAVMADYSWAEGAAAVFGAARERGIVSVLDADVGDMDAVRRLLDLPDHVVFSAACLARLAGTSDIAAGLRHARGLCRGVVAVTDGEHGFFWLEGDEVRNVPAFPVKAIDTNGAGDIFHGAYTLGLAEGLDVEGAARFASATAALKCAAGSGWESIPDRAAVSALLEGGRP
ncbi:sulfofructose kinase [Devosia enhydra]|uniref:Sulfofructose kinase n=1 Tax=Devosia enhydra TaxID=665118 RepID=A0A1K2HY25_9HYPH|nr:PfkB family carbohydrate kinase [Devosia enhydra]SFZ84675.1 sulfofructose kinase [Devosia enhydra]